MELESSQSLANTRERDRGAGGKAEVLRQLSEGPGFSLRCSSDGDARSPGRGAGGAISWVEGEAPERPDWEFRVSLQHFRN